MPILNQINSQLTGHGVLVKQGAISIVDASVTPTLRKLKGKSSYTLAEGVKRHLLFKLQRGEVQVV
jgi:hypothetical protein